METPYPVELAADVVGGEQSSGTFVKVPGETADLKERFRARIEEIKPLEDVSTPSLPGAAVPKDGTFHRAEVTLSFSIENMGTNLPTLIATVAGNLFELRDVSGLKLLDIAFPDVFRMPIQVRNSESPEPGNLQAYTTGRLSGRSSSRVWA